MGVTVAVARAAANVGGGNQDITTADLGGLTPGAVWFTISGAQSNGVAANDARMGIGAATSTTERWTITWALDNNINPTQTVRRQMTDECIAIITVAGAVDGEADFVTFIPNGVRINWGNAPAAAYFITAEFYAGTDLSAKADMFQMPNVLNGTVDVNTVGFEPDMLRLATGDMSSLDNATDNSDASVGVAINNVAEDQFCWAARSRDNQGATAASSHISDIYGCGRIGNAGTFTWGGEINAYDGAGFSCTNRIAADNARVGFLALAFNGAVDFWADIIDTPIAIGNQSQNGPGFTPQSVACGLTQMAAINTAYTDANAGSLGLNCFDSDDEYCNSFQDEDAANPSNTQSLSTAAAVDFPDDDGTAAHAATFVSFDALGWTWNFSATEGTAVKWWALAIEEFIAPPPAPAVAAPLIARTQSRELTLVVRRPLWTDNVLIDDSLQPSGLRAIWTAQGGFWSLAFNLRGSQSEVEDWIDDGLGRQIQLYSPDLLLIWDGYASKISGNIGSLSIARGPLVESVTNKAQVAFSTVDYSVSPPAVGVRENTAWVEDADSQAKYGIVERVVSLAGSTLAGAEQVRDTIIDEMREPTSEETDNLGSTGETSVTVECLGWIHWLNAYTYFSQTTGSTTASVKLQAVLAADPNGIFSSDFSDIATNTTPVGAWDDDYRQAWSVIKGIVGMGDATFSRYLFGVYAGRKAKYNALPTAPKYQRALADPGQWLELFGAGGHVNPWDVEPGEWVFYTDFLIGRSQPTTLRLDPRYLLIEQAQFTAPWSLTMQGGKSARLDQLLARMGLAGSSG